MFNLKSCPWLDSNRGPLASEATTLSTEPQCLLVLFPAINFNWNIWFEDVWSDRYKCRVDGTTTTTTTSTTTTTTSTRYHYHFWRKIDVPLLGHTYLGVAVEYIGKGWMELRIFRPDTDTYLGCIIKVWFRWYLPNTKTAEGTKWMYSGILVAAYCKYF